MCEIEPFKRRFLEAVVPEQKCCVFQDACELFTVKKLCARHKDRCDPWLWFSKNNATYYLKLNCRNDLTRRLRDMQTKTSHFMPECKMKWFGFVCLFWVHGLFLNDCCAQSIQDLPESLLVLTAGFSCKSFSKLNSDYQNLLDAIRTDNKDSSVTFNLSKRSGALRCTQLIN